MVNMESAIEIRELVKRFRGFELKVDRLSLPRGAIMGLIGPNGAGKTTLIKLILGLLRSDAGTLRLLGAEWPTREAEVKARIGFVQDTPTFYDHLTLEGFAGVVARFYARWDWERFQGLVREFGLPPGRRLSGYSRGMRMKAALAMALCHHPELLVLDEPTSGLDPVFRREFLHHLQEFLMDEQRAVLFSTQITSDLERVADYITYLRCGEVRLATTRDDLRERWALVKGGTPAADLMAEGCFRSVRVGAHGFVALTDQAERVRRGLPEGWVMETASLEDIMVFLADEEPGQGVCRDTQSRRAVTTSSES